jgi:hypothetical protein
MFFTERVAFALFRRIETEFPLSCFVLLLGMGPWLLPSSGRSSDTQYFVSEVVGTSKPCFVNTSY